MYLFKANYLNCDTDEELTRDIEIDGQFLDSEKECYLCAMARAYEEKKINECFISIELFYC